VLFACDCSANVVERRAGTDGQGVMIRSAEAEARRTFGNLEDAELLTRAVVDIDLAAGDVDISICIRDYSGSAAFGKGGRGQGLFFVELRDVGAGLIFTHDVMAVATQRLPPSSLLPASEMPFYSYSRLSPSCSMPTSRFRHANR
jgi:hypothetical protein